MAELVSLSYKRDGATKRLVTMAQVEAAISNGLITPDTRVTLMLSDDSNSERPAADHPLLAPLLAQYAPPEPEPEPEPLIEAAPEPTPAPAPTPAPTPPDSDATDDNTDAKDATAQGSAPASAQVSAMPMQSGSAMPFSNGGSQSAPTAPSSTVTSTGNTGGQGNGALKTLALIVAGLIILVLAYKLFVATPDQGGDTSGESSSSIFGPLESDTKTEDDAAAEPDSETFYVTVTAPLRSRPTGKSSTSGDIARGTKVSGYKVRSENDAQFYWLRITDGPYKGQHVYFPNLEGNAPMPLDSSSAGDYYAAERVPLYATPDTSGRLTEKSPNTLAYGARVVVAGTVNGMAEVKHDRGGVAYADWSLLSYSDPSVEAYTGADTAAYDDYGDSYDNSYSGGGNNATADMPARPSRSAAPSQNGEQPSGESTPTADLPAYRSGYQKGE